MEYVSATLLIKNDERDIKRVTKLSATKSRKQQQKKHNGNEILQNCETTALYNVPVPEDSVFSKMYEFAGFDDVISLKENYDDGNA